MVSDGSEVALAVFSCVAERQCPPVPYAIRLGCPTFTQIQGIVENRLDLCEAIIHKQFGPVM